MGKGRQPLRKKHARNETEEEAIDLDRKKQKISEVKFSFKLVADS
jgi:hypothetical protein